MSDIAIRVAKRLSKTAMKVYFADLYYHEGEPEVREVPDDLWNPADPMKSMADIARAIDTEAGADLEEGDQTTFDEVWQAGSDWVGAAQFGAGAQGESPSVFVVGPTASQTMTKLMQAMEAWNEETVPELEGMKWVDVLKYGLANF